MMLGFTLHYNIIQYNTLFVYHRIISYLKIEFSKNKIYTMTPRLKRFSRSGLGFEIGVRSNFEVGVEVEFQDKGQG